MSEVFVAGTLSKVIYTMTNNPDGSTASGATAVTLANTDWKLKKSLKIIDYTNAKTGILRRPANLQDGSGTVNGFLDDSTPPEAEMLEGSWGTLKLYTTATHFYQLTAIVSDVDIDTGGPMDGIKVSYTYQLQSGTITPPLTS